MLFILIQTLNIIDRKEMHHTIQVAYALAWGLNDNNQIKFLDIHFYFHNKKCGTFGGNIAEVMLMCLFCL